MIKFSKICLILCTVFVQTAKAQPIPLGSSIKNAVLIEDKFHEGYEENINVSSGVIVGMIIGQAAGLQSIQEIFMDKSGWPDANAFCLRTSSNDGLFWAENSYKTDKTNFWKISPITRKFNSQIDKYGNENIIAKVTLSTSLDSPVCSKTNVIYAPVISKDTNNSNVNLYINSSNRYTFAEIWQLKANEDGKLFREITCKSAEVQGASIFDQICSFNLSELNYSGIAELRLFFETPFGTEQWNEKIAIPKH